jgi:hypothetical protein
MPPFFKSNTKSAFALFRAHPISVKILIDVYAAKASISIITVAIFRETEFLSEAEQRASRFVNQRGLAVHLTRAGQRRIQVLVRTLL